MSKRSFSVNIWLQQNKAERAPHGLQVPSSTVSYSTERSSTQGALKVQLPPLPIDDIQAEGAFRPSEYLIPGWAGSSLFDGSALSIKKLQEKLWQDAIERLQRADNFPRSLEQAIHQEFLVSSFRPTEGQAQALEKQDVFWREIRKEKPLFEKHVIGFRELYSFRVATNYLLRLKFLITFSKASNFSYSRAHIINPSTFSQQLFRKGSSQEIYCEAFKFNQYSWYRPTADLATELEGLARNIHKLTVTQLMKLCSFRSFSKSKKSLNFDDKSYSHALSHKAFGQFLNQLLVFFPLWQKNESFAYPRTQGVQSPEILNIKFVGSHIESLGQSHWLAQEANMAFKWSEILCPEFSTTKPGAEKFIKLGQELQFLTFLVQYAERHNLDTRKLICDITQEKFQKSQRQKLGQFNLFNQRELAYDRVVLNVGQLPKKNPHHFLIQKIQEQKASLLEGGHMIVLSQQKLFVPSQSKKVATLLKDFKVEAIFDFEKLKARGEISNYIYILKKRDPFAKGQSTFNMDPLSLTSHGEGQQESCFTFRFYGELTLFLRFEGIVKELFDFFKKRSSYTVSLLHRIIDSNLNMEFHQDAIIEGKLLSSLNNDKENVTHPQFFKKLTKSCVPLEKYFTISEVNQKNKSKLTDSFLGINSGHQQGQYLLIVDYRDQLNPSLEICSMASYSAKRQELGEAYYHYYSMTPKVTHLNLNLLREFFDLPLGKQIIQICLSGGVTKLKGRVRALLIPRFFGDGHELQGTSFEQCSFLNMTKDELLHMEPESIKQTFEKELSDLQSKEKGHTWTYLSLLGHIKALFKSALEEIESEEEKPLFANPSVKNELVHLETVSVYPNEEVYTELLIERKEDLQRPLSGLQLREEISGSVLEVYARAQSHDQQDQCLIKFYAEKELLLFIEFILSQAGQYPLLGILQNLKVPRLIELKNVLQRMNGLEDVLKDSFNGANDLLRAKITAAITMVD